jgi:hypothetical protein
MAVGFVTGAKKKRLLTNYAESLENFSHNMFSYPIKGCLFRNVNVDL